MIKCPACDGEGFKSSERNVPLTDKLFVIMDFEECEGCEGTGEVETKKPPSP